MTTPNMLSLTTINGKASYNTPSTTSNTVFISNPAASNKLIKINSIFISNIEGTNAFAATVSLNTMADGSGSSYSLIYTINVPSNSSITILDKPLYLEENKSIIVKVSTANTLTFISSYEELS